eukprot:scaffold5534_cov86-Skeletonema_dohrnii-CCMP3373.AAC.2
MLVTSYLQACYTVHAENNQVPAGIAPSGQLARQTLDWEGCEVIEDMHPSSLISQPRLDQPTKFLWDLSGDMVRCCLQGLLQRDVSDTKENNFNQ